MKSEYYHLIIPVTLIIFMSVIATYGVYSFYEVGEEQLILHCKLSKIVVINQIIQDIKIASDHQALCQNDNCTVYFQKQMDIRFESMNFIQDEYEDTMGMVIGFMLGVGGVILWFMRKQGRNK